jgi:hypothetical protein
VYGAIEAFTFNRSHLGGRLIEGVNYEVLSDESRKLEDAAVISQTRDVLKALASPAFSQQLGDQLRATANTESVKSPIGAVELALQELNLRQSEKESILETFIQDGDYSQWGLASAVTALANDESDDVVSYERAAELENVGAKILQLKVPEWNRYVHALPKAA